MTTYIKELIDLPERVHGGDFVLKLAEGVQHPDETLRPYVVTPELARNFDDALDFIKGAIQSSSSKAAYLHGRFGSDERSRLIGALVDAFFQSYKEVARGSEEAFVSLDDGLAITCRHAQSLGYDALVLFLEELILWLATHAADQKFLNLEGAEGLQAR